jgi:demethylspheroidene O-methyltransferase
MNVHAVMRQIVVCHSLADAPKAGEVYFNLYLLAMGSGRARSHAEIDALLQASGFARAARLATRYPQQTGVLVARRR